MKRIVKYTDKACQGSFGARIPIATRFRNQEGAMVSFSECKRKTTSSIGFSLSKDGEIIDCESIIELRYIRTSTLRNHQHPSILLFETQNRGIVLQPVCDANMCVYEDKKITLRSMREVNVGHQVFVYDEKTKAPVQEKITEKYLLTDDVVDAVFQDVESRFDKHLCYSSTGVILNGFYLAG